MVRKCENCKYMGIDFNKWGTDDGGIMSTVHEHLE